jgi:hypothetical protein
MCGPYPASSSQIARNRRHVDQAGRVVLGLCGRPARQPAPLPGPTRLSCCRNVRSAAGRTDGVAFSGQSGSFREVVIRRLRYLPEATLALLQIAAVLGDTVSVADVAAVARREPGESPFAMFFDYRVQR